ncbi:hypothetical protein [Neorhizobium sp. NCHU2750]|uniref:hypothetical protein n=1 Tax=Neorhizobium sp. NCHU2750 TaxID=1825976 RepID=UPI000E743FB9|nr:hypothetical protein NCHU2750_15450 [Neorhizobium sp. NCHU2750]
MLQQFTLYIILGLIAVIVILGGCWWYQSSRDAATIDTLKANNARLEDAVSTNEKTIAQMVADAQTLAAANAKLTHSIMATEMEQAASWNAIDALDLTTDSDASGIETKANDAFAASIDAIRAITVR